jgi:hypothetical protein
MAANLAGDRFDNGAFDEAIAVLNEVDPGEESGWTGFFTTLIEQIRWTQSGDPVHLERAREANRPLLEAHEPQYRSGAVDSEVGFRWLEGDLDGVLEMAPQVDPALPFHLFRHHAIGAALRLGDPARVRAAVDLIDTPVGRRFEVLRLAGDTAIEVLEGDPDRGAAMFGDLINKLKEVESPRLAAEWRAVFGEVMPDRPEANFAAKEAYDWFSEVGARGYLDLFSQVWDRQLGQQAAAG